VITALDELGPLSAILYAIGAQEARLGMCFELLACVLNIIINLLKVPNGIRRDDHRERNKI
jgi:hypothetical protein